MTGAGAFLEMVQFWSQNPVLAALLLIAYVFYTTHYGRMSRFIESFDVLVATVIALAHEVDGIDEMAVHEALDNSRDSSLFVNDKQEAVRKETDEN